MPVGRTIPSTRHGETTDVPLGYGDSDRDVAHSRSDWLSSRSRRQRRHVSNAGRRSRFRFVPATDRHSLLLFPTTATSLLADVPWLPSRPASQRSTLRSHGNSPCWNRSSQQTAAAALTMRSSTSPHTVSPNPRSHTQRTLSSSNSTSLRSTFPHRCRTLQKYVRSLARSTLNCRLSRNFFASPLKTCFSREHT